MSKKIIVPLIALAGVVVFALMLGGSSFFSMRTLTVEHANLVLNEEGCKAIKSGDGAVETRPAEELKGCRVEDVTVSSKGILGERDFVGIRNIPSQAGTEISLPRKYVVWVETKSANDEFPATIRISEAAFGR